MTNDLDQVTTDPVPLPGLEDPPHKAATLELAVRRTIAALHTDGNVTEHDAARCALAIELAQIITAKRNSGRTSTVGNDARVLVELLDKMLPAESAVDHKLTEAMALWAAENQST